MPQCWELTLSHCTLRVIRLKCRPPKAANARAVKPSDTSEPGRRLSATASLKAGKTCVSPVKSRVSPPCRSPRGPEKMGRNAQKSGAMCRVARNVAGLVVRHPFFQSFLHMRCNCDARRDVASRPNVFAYTTNATRMNATRCATPPLLPHFSKGPVHSSHA